MRLLFLGCMIILRSRAEPPSDFLQTESVRDFLEVGKQAGTDKVGPHTYQNVYGKFLKEWKGKANGRAFKMLEIGLGCNMNYGPGASVALWRKWFGAGLELHEMEYDRGCAQK